MYLQSLKVCWKIAIFQCNLSANLLYVCWKVEKCNLAKLTNAFQLSCYKFARFMHGNVQDLCHLFQSFPAETFAPKLQMERDIEPKKLPRNVDMERKWRVYRNSTLDELLREEKIRPQEILSPEIISLITSYEEKYGLFSQTNYLPLEIFDDEEYDCRQVFYFVIFIRHLATKNLQILYDENYRHF